MAAGRKTGGGSRKGKPNRLTADVKTMILTALSAAGGAEYLLEQSQKNPVAFMALVGKVLPLQLTGANGGPVLLEQIASAALVAVLAKREEEKPDNVGIARGAAASVPRTVDHVAYPALRSTGARVEMVRPTAPAESLPFQRVERDLDVPATDRFSITDHVLRIGGGPAR